MSTIKQALRQLAEGVGREEWQARKEPGIGGEHTVIVKGSLVKRAGWSTHRPIADQVVDKKTAKFIAAANPATVLALLDELEAKNKAWSAQDNHINQQAERIESLEQKNGELGGALGAAERRIAELEARSVKLPEGYSTRLGHPINEDERGVMIPKEGGAWLSRFGVEHALRVAGITVKGDSE